jgi:hypothetical protein
VRYRHTTRLFQRGAASLFALLTSAALSACGGGSVRLTPPPAGAAVAALNATASGVQGTIPTATQNTVALVSQSFASPSPAQVQVAIATQGAASAIEQRAAAIAGSTARATTGAIALRESHLPALPVRRLGIALAPPTAAVTRRSLAAGTQQSFYIAVASIGEATTSYVSVPFTLAATTKNTNVWFASSFETQYAGKAAQIGSDIETALASDTRWLGLPLFYTNAAAGLTTAYQTCDASGAANGMGRAYVTPYAAIDVLIVPPGVLGSGVGGQFNPSDLAPQNIANCNHAKSNEAATITVALDPSTTNLDYYFQDFISHEATHLIAYVNSAIALGRDGTIPGAINEGLASLAEDLVGSAPDYNTISQHVTPFLQAPQNYAILSMNGIEGGKYAPYTLGNYGASYLLMRYIADRYGLGFAHAYIVNDPTTSDARSFATLASSAGASSFSRLYSDFGTTLAASSGGIYLGPPYAITSYVLRGTYIGPSPTATSTSFTLPGVSPSGTLPGTSTVPLFPGGIAILDATAALAGGSFSITDPTASLHLTGTIVSY